MPAGIDVGPDGEPVRRQRRHNARDRRARPGRRRRPPLGRARAAAKASSCSSRTRTARRHDRVGWRGRRADGLVYVADTVNDRVQQFRPRRHLRSGVGRLTDPRTGSSWSRSTVAVGPTGPCYVVDLLRDDIQRVRRPRAPSRRRIGRWHGYGDATEAAQGHVLESPSMLMARDLQRPPHAWNDRHSTRRCRAGRHVLACSSVDTCCSRSATCTLYASRSTSRSIHDGVHLRVRAGSS